MRDLGQVLAHIHDAEIEIGEGAEPPNGAAQFMRRSQPVPRLPSCRALG